MNTGKPLNFLISFILILVLVGAANADQVTLVANCTGCYGYRQSTINERDYRETLQYSDLTAPLTTLTSDDLNKLSAVDDSYLTQAGDKKHDEFIYVNFTLKGVQSVNYVIIKSVTKVNEFYTQLGLYNATSPAGGGWTALDSIKKKKKFVTLTYNVSTESDKNKYLIIDAHSNLNFSINVWMSGGVKSTLSADYYEAVVDYVPASPAEAPEGAPAITGFSPSSPVSDTYGATRVFNITYNQTVNVVWYLNGTMVQANTSVTEASYTNTSAPPGTWNLTAIATNSNGAASKEWTWSVAAITTTGTGTSSGGGGGGGGGVASEEPNKNIQLRESREEYLRAGDSRSFIFTTSDLVINEVLITPAKSYGLTNVKVEQLNGLPTKKDITSPEGTAYIFSNIRVNEKEIAKGSGIKDAAIKFKVNNNWLSDNKLSENDMVLLRWMAVNGFH